MSEASNQPFVLSRPPTEDFLQVARELNRIATQLGIPFFLAGAAARDMVLVNLWGRSRGRATADIDFAFAVNDWLEYERLRERLLETKRFERVRHQQQRLLYNDPKYGFQVPVDFIPFGGIASPTQTIDWPPKSDFVMNVAGFAEAFTSALRIELETGLAILVASLPGLAVLKTIAWADRHQANNKDAADLYRVLSTYDTAGNQDRIFDQELDLLESVEYDLTLAGAHLLGRDAARISDIPAARQIGGLLRSDVRTRLLVSHMIATASDEDPTSITRAFECYRQGYLDGTSSAATDSPQ